MNATIITIGDELLIGQVIDTNSAWMSQELNKIGISVIRKITVGDDQNQIITAFAEAKQYGDLILISGGLGPTNDDITKDVLAAYFGVKTVFHEDIFAMVKGFFDRLNRPMPESNRRQAELPENCIPIKNFHGTAPGMWFEEEGKVYVSMPGVPHELKMMLTSFVIPKLQSHFKTPFILHKTIHTQGIGESALAEKIQDIEESFPPGVKLAYLPNLSLIRLRITAKGDDEKKISEVVSSLAARLKERLGDFIWGYDDDVLEETVGRLLLERHASLSIAESCTGGLIAYKIVSIPGASEYFKGSIVSYSNESKMHLLNTREETLNNFGAVSEETVKEMAMGAINQLNSDFAIAISGIAGPNGGTDEKPVGTACIAVGNKDNIITKKILFPGNRQRIMESASVSSLNMLRKFILAN